LSHRFTEQMALRLDALLDGMPLPTSGPVPYDPAAPTAT
jgi:hypothetical protein